jgi:pyruvate dehydrogenase E1 component alpha subunit
MTKDEKAAAMAQDPVPLFRAKLIADGVATEDQLAGMEAKIAADIQEAIEFALASDMPPIEELTRDVYAEQGVA